MNKQYMHSAGLSANKSRSMGFFAVDNQNTQTVIDCDSNSSIDFRYISGKEGAGKQGQAENQQLVGAIGGPYQ